jgi:hypothetical protein
MRRLVYAPKVWIFIRSSNEDGKIYDVSQDVVRGSVTQNLGDLSKARFELRNRFYKWLRSQENQNKQIFLPMDLCTIWMQRIAGKPVQVFTGYLDEVPYYQAYPGNAIFSASCTMKRLAYNWFDPGLPTFSAWLRANGWVVDPTTGAASALTTPDVSVGPDGQPTDSNPLVATSANFAELLGRFMVDVAGWEASDVVIGTLPPDMGEQAAKLYGDIEDATEGVLQEASDFMSQAMGLQGAEAMQSAISENATDQMSKILGDDSKLMPPTAMPVVKQVSRASTTASLPSWLLVFAGLVLTNFNPQYRKSDSSGAHWGYGLYALRPFATILPGLPLTVDGVSIDNLRDAGVATRVMAARLNKNRGPWSDQAVSSDNVGAALTWISKAVGYDVKGPLTTKADAGKLLKVAKKVTSAQTVAAQQASVVAVKADSTPLTDDKAQKFLTDDEKKLVKGAYASAAPEVGAAVLVAKAHAPRAALSDKGKPGGLTFFVTGTDSDLARLFTFYKNRPEYAKVEYKSSGPAQVLQGGVASSTPSDLSDTGIRVTIDQGKFDALGTINLTIDASGDLSDPGEAQEAGLTLKQLAAFSANAAFAADLSFGGDITTAFFLRGDRALMNDVSCLDGVKQICAASLRTFRSLPDGRFLAFYPDYFGKTRDPYWKIRDIETIDLGIQLNDEALATHVYVVGDSFFGAGGGPMADLLNEVRSGVATLSQANMLGTFIEDLEINTATAGRDANAAAAATGSVGARRLAESLAFLNHYGARPHREDQPLIRNPVYEFLYAWQKFMWLWSQQFATNCTFTFQPEVMAGGLIEFPDHGLMMFCESVTHTFDYSGGFTTQAVMSAPSIPKGKRTNDMSMPGFALQGGANTVGVG